MSLSADEKRHLLGQLAALSDAAISADQLRDLHATVKSNSEARQLYVEHLFLDALLNWSLDKEEPALISDECAEEHQKVALASLPGDLMTARAESRPTRSANRFALPARFVALAASLLLVGYFVTIGGLVVMDYIRRANHPEPVVQLPSDSSSATLVRADNADWREDSSAASTARGGQRSLQVRTGFAELKFAQGAKVVVSGPADFEIRSPNRGFLRRGKLVALVPPEAIGFAIETPTAEVVDLGTEFGVEVDEHGNAKVHVFLGAVVARPKDPSTARTRAVRVAAGNALHVDGPKASFTSAPINHNWRAEFMKVSKLRGMTIAEWEFERDANLSFVANGAPTKAQLRGEAKIDPGVALGSLAADPRLEHGFLSTLFGTEPHDEAIRSDATWGQLFGTTDFTYGTFVTVFKPNMLGNCRYTLLSHRVADNGQVWLYAERFAGGGNIDLTLRVGTTSGAEAMLKNLELDNTHWYFLGGSWLHSGRTFLYLRDITAGTAPVTNLGTVNVGMEPNVMTGPIYLGGRNNKSEACDSRLAYAALLEPYWNTSEQFDRVYDALVREK